MFHIVKEIGETEATAAKKWYDLTHSLVQCRLYCQDKDSHEAIGKSL